MKFSDIIGQTDLIKILKKNIDTGRVAHAQLFEGETGRGTLALAIAYVQYLNCNSKQFGDSCGVCSSCKKISSLQHPDLHFVYPVNKSDKAVNMSKTQPPTSDNFIDSWREFISESTPNGYVTQNSWYDFIKLNSKTIKPTINKLEADLILKKLTLKPTDSEFTMIIIWLPERMNESAANTLLKQFEEPVTNALFLFVTEDSSKIIKTIISRTQSITIPPISQNDIEQYLKENVNLTATNDISLTARISNGSIPKAIENMSSEIGVTTKAFDIFVKLMRYCYQRQHLQLLNWVDEFTNLDKENVDTFFSVAIETLRYSYMENIGLPELNISNKSERGFISKFYPYVSSQNIEQLIDNLEKASFDLYRNGNPKIVMTHFALSTTKLISPLK